MQKTKKNIRGLLIGFLLTLVLSVSLSAGSTVAAPRQLTYFAISQCGSVTTSINFGCNGGGTPAISLLFAVIRFLSDGVGLVVIASMVFAGIQYSMAGSDPQAVSKAKKRINSSIIALIVYIFAFAIINYLVPGGFLN